MAPLSNLRASPSAQKSPLFLLLSAHTPRMDINIGPNHGVGFIVREVWVALAVMGDGDEAVPAVVNERTGMMQPLIAADPKRLYWIQEQAKRLSQVGRVPIRIVKFSTREEVAIYSPL